MNTSRLSELTDVTPANGAIAAASVIAPSRALTAWLRRIPGEARILWTGRVGSLP